MFCIEPDGEEEPEPELTPEELLEQFKVELNGMDMHRFLKKRLETSTHLIEHFIEKDRDFIARIIIKSTERFIDRWSGRGIDEEDAEVLLSILEEVLEKL